MGIFQLFPFDVYVLLDPDSNLYFISPYVSMRVNFSPKVLLESFLVYTPVGDSF